MTTTRPAPATASPTPSTAGTNLAVVRGALSSPPTRRELPSGDVVHGYEVTVREPGRPAASVPVVVIGRRAPARLTAGDEVVVVGRIRRRYFRAGAVTASRTEVVADRIVPAARAARVDAAWVEARVRLDDLGDDPPAPGRG